MSDSTPPGSRCEHDPSGYVRDANGVEYCPKCPTVWETISMGTPTVESETVDRSTLYGPRAADAYGPTDA